MKEGDLVRFKGRGLWQITKINTYEVKDCIGYRDGDEMTEFSIEWFSGEKEQTSLPPFRPLTKLLCTRSCLKELTEMEILAYASL